MLNLDACPCAGNTLDRLIQPAILSVLSEGDLHGYGLAERLRRFSATRDGGPDISGIYRLLRVMQRKGLVESAWDLSHGGPPRRVYKITPDGRRCLARWVATLQRYRQAINGLIRTARSATAGHAPRRRGRPE